MRLKTFSLICLVCLLGVSPPSLAETVWIDVRTLLEHKIDHIEGDIRIAHSDIVPEVTALYPDRNTEIRLYCHSGGRSQKAMVALQKAGYANVANVGGIDDARQARGLTEQ